MRNSDPDPPAQLLYVSCSDPDPAAQLLYVRDSDKIHFFSQHKFPKFENLEDLKH